MPDVWESSTLYSCTKSFLTASPFVLSEGGCQRCEEANGDMLGGTSSLDPTKPGRSAPERAHSEGERKQQRHVTRATETARASFHIQQWLDLSLNMERECLAGRGEGGRVGRRGGEGEGELKGN